MKQYDVIAVGTGSVMAVVEAIIEGNPRVQIAVIDKDEPGGICLTRGCIPSKILLYPADLVRTIERAGHFGLDVELRSIDFVKVMERMHSLIHKDIDQIRKGLSSSENLDYFHAPAEFTAPYTMRVDGTEIHGSKILLGAGSEPIIPEIPGLAEAGYLTSDTVLRIRKLPPRVAVIGGGYIAAEYGFFLAAMGADVTILGRNPQFLPEEEPEVSQVARKQMVDDMRIGTNHAVPHAVYTDPEVASVGLKEAEAIKQFGVANVLIGFYRYQDTAKGEAMDVKDCFVKVLVEREGHAVLGAHIVGPEASVLIQEIINLMYTKDRSVDPLREGMHIHPALSEVVERACLSLMPPEHYHHTMEHALDIRSR